MFWEKRFRGTCNTEARGASSVSGNGHPGNPTARARLHLAVSNRAEAEPLRWELFGASSGRDLGPSVLRRGRRERNTDLQRPQTRAGIRNAFPWPQLTKSGRTRRTNLDRTATTCRF